VPARQVCNAVRLFRYLAGRANKGNAVGISYGDFTAFLHGKASFREVAQRNFLPSDSGHMIEQAWSVAEAKWRQNSRDGRWPTGSVIDLIVKSAS
jgi:hypothetical protein